MQKRLKMVRKGARVGKVEGSWSSARTANPSFMYMRAVLGRLPSALQQNLIQTMVAIEPPGRTATAETIGSEIKNVANEGILTIG